MFAAAISLTSIALEFDEHWLTESVWDHQSLYETDSNGQLQSSLPEEPSDVRFGFGLVVVSLQSACPS